MNPYITHPILIHIKNAGFYQIQETFPFFLRLLPDQSTCTIINTTPDL
jgi:hypothetical protein